MKIKIADTVENLAPSGIRAFFDLVLGMDDVISLGVGEPDFSTPWNIREKAIDSLEKGYTSYTSNKGMPEFRKAICQFLEDKHGVSYDFDSEVLITVGVSEALDLVMRAILNPGDKVLVPEPVYVSYAPTVELAYGKPVTLKTDMAQGFKITPDLIRECYEDGVKAIMINYPCNPTGTSYTEDELKALSDVIQELDLILISDEVYDELTYDFDHKPFSAFEGMKERTVYLNGFSKVYAMTGFRIGWAAGPETVISAMTKIHQYTMLCVPITGQIASIEALKNSSQQVQDMKKEYHRRRNYIVKALNEIGLDCHMPQGAFYAFPSIKNTGKSSMDFATELLQQQKVALVPGVAFGSACEGYVRISYASSLEDLKEAIARMKKYLNSIS